MFSSQPGLGGTNKRWPSAGLNSLSTVADLHSRRHYLTRGNIIPTWNLIVHSWRPFADSYNIAAASSLRSRSHPLSRTSSGKPVYLGNQDQALDPVAHGPLTPGTIAASSLLCPQPAATSYSVEDPALQPRHGCLVAISTKKISFCKSIEQWGPRLQTPIHHHNAQPKLRNSSPLRGTEVRNTDSQHEKIADFDRAAMLSPNILEQNQIHASWNVGYVAVCGCVECSVGLLLQPGSVDW